MSKKEKKDEKISPWYTYSLYVGEFRIVPVNIHIVSKGICYEVYRGIYSIVDYIKPQSSR